MPHTDIAPFENSFAHSIYTQKYQKDDEAWEQTAERAVHHPMAAIGMDLSAEADALKELVRGRQFMPGGRYLYASGRDLHQVQNCALYRAEDTREGWAELTQKVTMALMTGAGVGVHYGDVRPSNSIISRTGGVASGPISLMKIVNEIGRNVMQGGARRSAIWAGLPWNHPDVFEFIRSKDWSPDVRAMKEKDFTFPADLDMTNISVTLDDDFFSAYGSTDGLALSDKYAFKHGDVAPDGGTWHDWACRVYDLVVSKMLTTAEPGFSVDVGVNSGENLRNAPVCGGTNVLTRSGYKPVSELEGIPTSVWTRTRWADDVVFERTHSDVPVVTVLMSGDREIRCDPSHEFLVDRYVGAGTKRRLDAVSRVPAGDLTPGDVLHVSMPEAAQFSEVDDEAYTLGYIYGDGSFHKSGGVDLSLCTAESKACLVGLIGARSVNELDSRGFTRLYFSSDSRWEGRTKDEFPQDVYAMEPDSLRSFVAGLFDADGNYEPTQQRIRLSSKHREFLRGVGRALEQVGILAHVSKGGHSTYGKAQTWQLVVASGSTREFADTVPCRRLQPSLGDYKPFRRSLVKVLSVTPDGREDVYCADVKVPEHSFMAEGVIISNCTEITSADDSDICNLGSFNLARFHTKAEFARAVRLGTLFLIAGTVYSDLPHDEVHETRQKNRRLGLGLMGLHEWLLKRGKRYGPDDELAEWLDEYEASTQYAHEWADQLGLSRPVKTRAIAPNGTIGILAETTTSAEPIFAAAYKRRVRNSTALGDTISFEYVVDPTAARLVLSGVAPELIEDAYTLSYDVERRVEFQAWLQQWVDHGISSTVNLPGVITDESDQREFGEMLMKYLPKLRGITCYPDGSRGGQPLTSVPLEYALDKTGVRFEENEDRCLGGQCGV